MINSDCNQHFRGLQRIMWYYQAVSNIEDDVDSVQAVADVLPE